jgi:quinol monooxygenase YgiN
MSLQDETVMSQQEPLVTRNMNDGTRAMSGAGGFSVHGRITAQPGKRDALVERFREVLGMGILGLKWCSISTVLDEPDVICMTQIWTDKAAHDAGTRSDMVVLGTERALSLVAGPLEGSYGQVAYLQDEWQL